MADLLNVDEAIGRILEDINPLDSEVVSLPESLDRVLAEDLIASSNLPPFANSAMDGFALRAADSTDAERDNPVTLRVTQDIPAGAQASAPLNPGEAARIMTGAPLPPGADAIIPVEDTDADFSKLDAAPLPERVGLYRSVPVGAAVRQIGENVHVGQRILSAGVLLRPADLGILAALGEGSMRVLRRPQVAIISSGDELVDVDQTPAPGQIRDVNSYTLAALITQAGGNAVRIPIARDTPAAVRAMFQDALATQPDLIISSAGVSVGAADYVRAILEELGEIDFWRINLRPGKPFAYGKISDVPFFGLPGNPVSVMVTFEVLVRPVLAKLSGRRAAPQIVHAITREPLQSDGRRTYARVRLTREDGQLVASSTGTQSSGALLSMVIADGLLIIPEGTTAVEAGTKLPVHLLKPLTI